MKKLIAFATFALGIVGGLIAGEVKLEQSANELRRTRFVEGQQAV